MQSAVIGRFLQYFAPRISAPLMTLITLGVLARVLDADHYSQYIFFYAVAVILSGLSDAGVRDYYYYTVTAGLSQSIFNEIYKKKICAAIIIILSTLPLTLVYPHLEYSLLVSVAVLGCMLPVSDVGLMILKAKGRPGYELLLGVIEGVSAISLFIGVGSDSLTFQNCLLIVALLGACRSAGTFLLSRRCIDSDHVDAEHESSRAGATYSVLSIFFGNLYNRVPAVVLNDLLSPPVYNVFVTFLTLVQRLEMVPTALLQSQLAGRAGANGLRKRIIWLLFLLVIVGVSGAFVLYISAEAVVPLVMGHDYGNFAVVLKDISAIVPLVLLAYGARYFLQLEQNTLVVSCWLLFCLLQSALTLTHCGNSGAYGLILIFNYTVYALGFVVILLRKKGLQRG